MSSTAAANRFSRRLRGRELLAAIAVDPEPLPEPIALAADFIVAECLANTGRHAGAEAVVVQVARGPDAAAIEVRDDGCGGADAAAGTGLRGLADRVAALRGGLRVESEPGAGTPIAATIPLPSA